MKGIPLKKFIPGFAWFFVVLFIICLPKEDIPEVDGWWGWLNKIYFDKWIHVGIFAVMAFLFMYPFLKAPHDFLESFFYHLSMLHFSGKMDSSEVGTSIGVAVCCRKVDGDGKEEMELEIHNRAEDTGLRQAETSG